VPNSVTVFAGVLDALSEAYMNLKTAILCASAAGALTFGAMVAQAQATVLVVGSGWQSDEVHDVDTPSDNSPVTFTVPTGDTYVFRLSDAYLPGDIYSITYGSTTVSSAFVDYGDFAGNDSGPSGSTYAPAWDDSSYSHALIDFTQGSYSLSFEGDCAAGCPAGFGYRLDTSAVPEPATWTLLILGMGGVGATLRSRSRRALA
jgi:hypothetical protein